MSMFFQGQPKTVYKIGKKVRKCAKPFVQLKPREYMSNAYSTKDFPELEVEVKKVVMSDPVEYEGEMAEREAAANKESERRKTMVAPLYNKAGYEYIGGITDPTILRNLGRKI
jgi:hypothetical protein